MRSQEQHISPKSDYYVYTPTTTATQMFFYPICLGYFYYEPEYLIKREQYSSFLIMQITKGSCKITLPDSTFIAKKGDVVLIDCYTQHQYESLGFWEASWIHFDGPLARNYYDQIIASCGHLIFPRNLDVISHSLSKITDTYRNSFTIVEASISKYITNILTELLLSQSAGGKSQENGDPLAEVMSYINEHFIEQITLEELATISSLSPFYFTRVFTKKIGMTPHQYIIATRLNSAKFLLISTDFSIKEIAYNTGFSSESNFCATFKKWEHTTPSKYRTLSTT